MSSTGAKAALDSLAPHFLSPSLSGCLQALHNKMSALWQARWGRCLDCSGIVCLQKSLQLRRSHPPAPRRVPLVNQSHTTLLWNPLGNSQGNEPGRNTTCAGMHNKPSSHCMCFMSCNPCTCSRFFLRPVCNVFAVQQVPARAAKERKTRSFPAGADGAEICSAVQHGAPHLRFQPVRLVVCC